MLFLPQVKQFVSSRRQELVEMQSALLGFDDIAVKEGLRPTEEEIEVCESSVVGGEQQQLGGSRGGVFGEGLRYI